MNKINYNEIMALGFKEKPMQDEVYERQNGYPWVWITKKLTKKIYLEWEKETKVCKIIRLKSKKTGDIANSKVLTLDQVKEVIEFFCGRNDFMGERSLINENGHYFYVDLTKSDCSSFGA